MLPLRSLMQGLGVSGLYAGSCLAQREPPNMDRRDGPAVLFYEISFEKEPAKKLAALEKFAVLYPTDQSIGWIYDQTYKILVETNHSDRAILIAEKLLAIDPEDLDLAYENLKRAEEKKDPALVRKWAQITGVVASRTIATPRDTETGKRRLDLARQVATYVEYLAYAEILATTARPRKLEFMEEFLKASPNSSYAPAVQRLWFATLRESDPPKALAVAEQMIAADQANEDVLMSVAENYAQKDKEPDKVVAYAEKAILLIDRAGPAEKKAALSGRANWLVGSISMQQNNYAQADKSIRAALPYLKSDARLTSTALFYLGWANYKLGNITEAIRFTQDCTRIKGPFQEQAVKNLAVIRSEKPGR